jgi:hypothetical protein
MYYISNSVLQVTEDRIKRQFQKLNETLNLNEIFNGTKRLR